MLPPIDSESVQRHQVMNRFGEVSELIIPLTNILFIVVSQSIMAARFGRSEYKQAAARYVPGGPMRLNGIDQVQLGPLMELINGRLAAGRSNSAY